MYLPVVLLQNDTNETAAAFVDDALQRLGEPLLRVLGDMRQLAGQTIQKLHTMTDAAFEEAKFSMALSDTE